MAFKLSFHGTVAKFEFFVHGESCTLLKMRENLNFSEAINDILAIAKIITTEKGL